MTRHHTIITGTGRSGTTFLVQLFTRLGLDTGYRPEDLDKQDYDTGSRAGLELDVLNDDAPYVVKNPGFCDCAQEVFENSSIVIDRIFIPMRDSEAAAESRRHVVQSELASMSWLSRIKFKLKPFQVKGGLWHTHSGKHGEQEFLLLGKFYKLMLAASNTDVPVTFMRFPRIVKDPDYLYGKLRPALDGITYEQFLDAFNKTANPGLVHSFTPQDK